MKEGRESRMEAQLGKTRRLTSCMCNFKRHHRALSPVPFLSPPSLHPSPVPPLSKSELFKERNRETGQDVVQLSVIRPDDSSSSRSWAEFRSIDKRSCNKVHLARLPCHKVHLAYTHNCICNSTYSSLDISCQICDFNHGNDC